MTKLTHAGRSSAGVLETLVDTDDPYVQYAGKTMSETDGQDVAFIEVAANDTAAPKSVVTGNIVASTTPLGTATLTTDPCKTKHFGRIVGTIFSDTSGNLKIQQSNDGQNWDYSVTVAITGGTGADFSQEVVALYVRFVYAPTTSQTVFRFYPLLRRLGSA